MTISYNWLCDYLPEAIEPEKLSKILTSIGLEVESLEKYESIKGGLAGLVIGEVLETSQHPNADKLKLTKVNIGAAEPLQIVCGAANVAAGQKVVVATIGTTIYPVGGDPLTMKLAKIRGVESQGMICAEDEIGVGTSHDGILVMPADARVGSPAADHFKPYSDWIYEIGLTPNRMDAMSHYGVARDVCAYLTHHIAEARVRTPFTNGFSVDNTSLPIKVTIENTEACPRYAGVSISGVTVGESPKWLKDRLVAIGLRSINNIVDITNFILHETGQPLHAFDADAITGGQVIVKNLPSGTPFVTLDEKERKLDAGDLMICNAQEGMCIAGVFGGWKSGVTATTKNIFLESAWFHPVSIRKTSVRHELRTDAATRFEKGVDISHTVQVLKRAALLIKEIAGGSISSEIVDVYPDPRPKAEVSLKNHYLKKLSGKNYHADAIKRILLSLGFEIVREGLDELRVAVPYSKPDISIPADIVEEILRIDGLDNIEIPSTITISPAVEALGQKESLKDKIATYLVGQGFTEILTNSITNSKYFDEEVLAVTVKMINNLSEELNVLRPSMLETGLESIAYNLNRRNQNLQFFEIGKTYHTKAVGEYVETEHLCLYITGNDHEDSWREKGRSNDFYRLKGLATALFTLSGIGNLQFEKADGDGLVLNLVSGKKQMGQLMQVSAQKLQSFDIKQPVFVLDIEFGSLLDAVGQNKIRYREVNKFPVMQRDLAMVVNRGISFEQIEQTVKKVKLPRLQETRLFDVFESEKLGTDKKSMAISFLFADEEKTLTDKEVDAMIAKLIQGFEKDLAAEIRK
ncbi:MAG: phenylalanine--tRNA ligase subunit beta [Chitinophagaceae bacterium]|nr:phenylalanine--tRNA ligase subunit beta [Chitinophagaceae bacterium]MCA6451646.1 phenylalanine--tRNA ligase subunit beta [Chitinophagaceae bacterium]MCA6456279.1 phenylalanine--tRNA ligase subunit beta [Chitinophagaceae bacterium]MCA6460227.1 phenylalanine--tRNA ligase subunit beta [Chitinophagaceae bacterium]MCA6465114.1 phenylalanine--tRNA ligase subunit beta [Chitinophagaceae bacterium]